MSHPSRHVPPVNVTKLMHDRAAADIEKFGWHMMGVFPTTEDTNPIKTYFCYTVGLHKTYGQPEIAVFGLRPEIAHATIRRVIDLLVEGQHFVHGTRTADIAQGYDTVFRAVNNDHHEYPFRAAGAYYGNYDFPAVQMVLPDKENRFPWDEGCESKMVLSQQLLFDGLPTEPTADR